MRKYVSAHVKERLSMRVPPIEQRFPPKVMRAVKRASVEHDVTVRAILGRSCVREATTARQTAMRELRRGGYSFGQIGRWFGRHHTTVMYALRDKRAEREKAEASIIPVPDLSGEWAI